MKKSNLTQNGFTLIELMVTVVIIGILASIALPAYTDYIKKGKAAEATSALADLKIKAEQYYQDNRTYAGMNCAPTSVKYFTYACTNGSGSGSPDANGFTITATGVSGQNMSGFLFTIDQANNKTSKFDGSALASGCWLSSKAGTC